MTIRLPDERDSLIETRFYGTIIYVKREKGSYRLGVSTSPESHAQAVISEYISRRQGEIIAELKTLYDRFYRLKLAAREKH